METLARRCKTAQALALRARIVLGCASGKHNKDVAAGLGIDPVTVSKWRRRFLSDGLDGLRAEPRSGDATHWSSGGMARAWWIASEGLEGILKGKQG